jgi:hypothetical protein
MQNFQAPNAKAISWTIRAGILAFVLLGMFPPWTIRVDIPSRMHTQQSAGYHLIASPPSPYQCLETYLANHASVQIDWSRLALEWIILAGVVAVAFVWQLSRTGASEGHPNGAAPSNKQEASKPTEDKTEQSSDKETSAPTTEVFRNKIPTKDICSLPDLTPKHDERFSELLQGAVSGDVPVYFAAVPLAICVPFDPDYRPDLHPVGEQAISQMIEACRRGQFQKLSVYQRGKCFVVSDDYIPLFAALRGQPDYVPCWVLGKPDSGFVRDVQGPIAPGDIPKLLGWSQEDTEKPCQGKSNHPSEDRASTDFGTQSLPRSVVKMSELTPEGKERIAVALEEARKYDEEQKRAAKVPRTAETSQPAEEVKESQEMEKQVAKKHWTIN